MKKSLLVFLLLCSCLFSACSKYEEYGFVEVSGSEIISRITNKETLVVMIINDNSYSCDMFMQESESVFEEAKIKVHVLNEADIEDSQSMKDQLEIALGDYNSWPALFYVKEGTISAVDKYEYSMDPEGWKKWLQTTQLIRTEGE